ncbi:MAG: FxsA family protein [Pseudomonadota bacterium]
MWLLISFIAIPMLEIALFVSVGGAIGLWPTLVIVLATALLGSGLLRREGMAALTDLGESVRAGGDPTGPIAHGALILVAGLLLLTPGFFTDAVGLALMLAPVRRALFGWAGPILAARIMRNQAHAQRRANRPGGPVIDGQYEEVRPNDAASPGSGWQHPPAG